MTQVTLQGQAINTVGELPEPGADAPSFSLVGQDLSEVSIGQFSGKRLVLNIFPSIDTGTCATSVRTFNQRAGELENTQVLCVSADLPFALGRFCGAEGIENVATASSFRSTFGQDYGVNFIDGPLAGLLSRAVIVVGTDGKVIYSEQVAEIVDEPNYDAAIAALS